MALMTAEYAKTVDWVAMLKGAVAHQTSASPFLNLLLADHPLKQKASFNWGPNPYADNPSYGTW